MVNYLSITNNLIHYKLFFYLNVRIICVNNLGYNKVFNYSLKRDTLYKLKLFFCN